jgi:GNAT superfamily N-acetyltransferase
LKKSQCGTELVHSRIESPLRAGLTSELTTFWEDIFGVSYERFCDVLAGAEQGLNRNILYLVRYGSKLVGTTQLTVSCSNPQLGGLGEVATATLQRRRGIGRKLSEQARDDFSAQGGEALFLGTVNRSAEQIYHSLGWQKFASANVMCLVTGDRSPEEFLVDHFRGNGDVHVTAGSATQRIAMIPLIVCPHNCQILDANLNLFSTRYAVQGSCMGLFPRYETLRHDAAGEWFAATTLDGRLVGLATARRHGADVVQVDGFAHRNFSAALRDLLMACLRWAEERGATQCLARIATGDEKKREVIELLGLSQSGDSPDFNCNGTAIRTISFTMDCPRSRG